jgi:uncharacterized membrane protein YoaK (UPF0700 family)
VIALVGVVALWSHRRPVALLLLGPFVVCMAAAIAHQYPTRGRLVVWLLPSLLLAVAAVAEWMRRQISRLHPAFGWALVIVLLVTSVRALAAAPPPYRPGDLVYVLQLQQIGTTFYWSPVRSKARRVDDWHLRRERNTRLH